MKAVVMAGGEGTRLRPLTVNQPKPMLPVVNRPLAEHVLHLLRRHGFDDVVVTVAYLANTIRTYFGTGAEFGVRMVYATEESPLGTAGSVRHAQAELRERFLVISGDVLTDVDLGALLRFHESVGAVATLALKPMDNPLEFGIVITDAAGRIVRFLEKPTWGQVFSDTVNTGIYVLEPEVLDWIPAGRPVDFAAEVFPALLEAGLPLYGWVTEGYWEDVGTLEAYLRAHQDALDGRVALDIPGFPVRPGVFVGEGAEVDTAATVVDPVVVGPNCRVGAGAVLGPYTVLGANVRVGDGARLERCVVHDNTYVAPGADLAGCVVGRSSDVRRGARLEEGVVVGDECQIGAHAVLTPGVKVYPHKTVESGAVVTSSIVWETRGARSLFGSLGVTGLANVDLSPEVAVRVALAYASLLPKGSTVSVSRDSSRAARMLKRAAMVGITAAGCSVEDLEVATVPVTRFQVRTGASRGGLTVRLVRGDPQSVVLRFLDEGGLDLDEQTQRKVDRLYHREESRRVLAAEIGDIDFPPRTLELYTAELAGTVDLEAIRRSRFKLVLDYAHGSACFVMPNVLSKLGAEVLAVNPHISTPGVLSFDRDRHARRLGELVRSSGAHLGAVIDPDGEQLTLVDDSGAVLDDEVALLAFVALVGEAMPGVEVAVPVVASREVELLARRVGARLVWAKISPGGLLEAAVREQVGFAGSTWGGFVFPDFLPAYDAVAALLQLLGLLARRKVRLSEVVGGLARPRVAHREVPTPVDHKGLVMRVVLERAKGEEVVLVDGVKVADEGGWTLVVPDAERPVTHVYAEGASPEASESRAAIAAAQVAAIAASGEEA